MDRKVGLVAAVLGVLALRSLRGRRKTAEEPMEMAEEKVGEEFDEVIGEVDTAGEHAAAALTHARTAVEKAVETVREEAEQFESVREEIEPENLKREAETESTRTSLFG